jgi:hypothetical protein
MPLTPNELADAMVAALPRAWQDAKGEPFPGGDTADAKVMFLAVARGLLTYLENNQAEIFNSITFRSGTTDQTLTVVSVDVDTNLI